MARRLLPAAAADHAMLCTLAMLWPGREMCRGQPQLTYSNHAMARSRDVPRLAATHIHKPCRGPSAAGRPAAAVVVIIIIITALLSTAAFELVCGFPFFYLPIKGQTLKRNLKLETSSTTANKRVRQTRYMMMMREPIFPEDKAEEAKAEVVATKKKTTTTTLTSAQTQNKSNKKRKHSQTKTSVLEQWPIHRASSSSPAASSSSPAVVVSRDRIRPEPPLPSSRQTTRAALKIGATRTRRSTASSQRPKPNASGISRSTLTKRSKNNKSNIIIINNNNNNNHKKDNNNNNQQAERLILIPILVLLLLFFVSHPSQC